MNTNKPRILLIGALPPPAIGPFVAMQRLVGSTVLNGAFAIDFLDISDRRAPTNIGRFDWVNLVLGAKHALQCLFRVLFLRPDVVYLGISQGIWGWLRDLTFIVPAICLRRPLVLHLRGSEFRMFYDQMPAAMRWLTRRVLARASRVIVLGEGLKRVFAGLVSPDRMIAIPNGINATALTLTAEASARAPGKRILYLSSLQKRKGLFLLLEALPAVFTRHGDASVTIAGLWQSATERAEAEALIARLGLQDKLTFVGEVSGARKANLYHTHDVFAFTPVEPEGLPWVVLEAMSAGLPVVTTDQGAIADVVQHDRTGFIATPTPQNVAESICFLLDHPTQARAMGKHAQARITEHFSETTYLAKLLAVFEQAAGKGPKDFLRFDSSEKSVPRAAVRSVSQAD